MILHGGSIYGMIDTMDIYDRLDKRLNKTDTCWLWVGKSTDKNGYARIRVNGITELAHRISYTIYKGEIPKGIFVCHSCDVPGCCNPEHLWLGTNSDNMKDCSSKGRIRNGSTRKIECKRGHVYVDGSYYQYEGSSRRICKECILIRQRFYRKNGGN